MKSYSNTYIFMFSTVMVLIVAAVLSFVSERLRPIQENNAAMEKKLQILKSVGRGQGTAEATDKDAYIEEQYKEFITGSFVIGEDGERREGVSAFDIVLKDELSKDTVDRDLPVYIYTDADSSEKYIFPLRGTGLWGPIWGYVSLDSDFSTIYGATFSHEKETPGLGAEIAETWFQKQFTGLKIFDEQGNFTSIQVVKGGAPEGARSAVDAVSGGTITSKALQKMMLDCLGNYLSFFESKRAQL